MASFLNLDEIPKSLVRPKMAIFDDFFGFLMTSAELFQSN